MPSIRIVESNVPDKFKQIEYESGTELLKDVMKKYDERLSSENTNLAFGQDLIINWDVSMEECLFYGDFISFFTYNITFKVKFETEMFEITIDKRNSLMSLHSLLKEKLHLDAVEYLVLYLDNESLVKLESEKEDKQLEKLKFNENTLVHAIKATHNISIYANYQDKILRVERKVQT